MTPAELKLHRQLDVLLVQLQRQAQLLPAVSPNNGAEERARLSHCVAQGKVAEPRFLLPHRPFPRHAWGLLSDARRLAADAAFSPMYQAKLDELELDLLILEALGEPKRVRPLSARRFGTGRDMIPSGDGQVALAELAEVTLLSAEGPAEEKTLEAQSVVAMMQEAAEALGLELDIRVDPRLSAGAATGQKTILIASRRFGLSEARRLVVHEVYGHAVAAANARAQPIRLFDVGTAGSFSDQEGLALYLEAQIGALQGYRLRMIAARVWTADRMYAGASFASTAARLHQEFAFDPLDAVVLSERAYRGGGVARDTVYLAGYQRVKHHLEKNPDDLHLLRSGRLAVRDLSVLPMMEEVGAYRLPRLCPGLPASPTPPRPQDPQDLVLATSGFPQVAE